MQPSPPYQKAIDESGYNFKLTYNPEANQTTRNRKNRKRNITWYNPPWDVNVKTNLGKKFLGIVDKCFSQNHPLHKIFNRHTLKLSYSCMPNMKTIIASHKCPNDDTAATKRVQLPKQNRVPTRWKVPSTKCGLPSNNYD